jgi:hypothetical protein
MGENPYIAPAEYNPPPRMSIWTWVGIAGTLLIGMGIVAVIAAHVFTPRRYAFLAIALTEKIVWLGLLIAIVGALGCGIHWLRSRINR